MLKFVRSGLAAALVFSGLLLACAAPAATPGAVTPEEGKQLQDLVDAFIIPAANDLTDAIALSQTDQPKACETAKKAVAELTEGAGRFKSIRDGMIAKGEDVLALDDLNGKLPPLVAQAQDAANQICTGAMTDPDQDPEVAAMVKKITDYARTYMASESDAVHAKASGDTQTYCAKELESRATLTDMHDYVAGLRQRAVSEGATAADLTPIDDFLAKNKAWMDENSEHMKECPAGASAA